MAPKHLNRLLDPTLLERKLGEGCDRGVAFVVEREGFAAECGSTREVLFPLVEREGLVHEWEGVRESFSDAEGVSWRVKGKGSGDGKDGK